MRNRIANKRVRRRAHSDAVVVAPEVTNVKSDEIPFENKDPVYCTAAMYQVGSQARRSGVLNFGAVRWMHARLCDILGN
jgi:hypothetical protein